MQNSLLANKQKTVLFKLLLDAILANANESSGILQGVLLNPDKIDTSAFESTSRLTAALCYTLNT